MTLKTITLAAAFGAAILFSASATFARDIQTMVVAGGCFWCVESDFESVSGVSKVVSGYTGGTTANPTYKTLKGSGHYEAVKITYDADRVSYKKLIELFIRSVDPTDVNGQFCDRGPSYRTAVFVKTQAQQQTARNVLRAAQSELGKQIVTPILNEAKFYDAESYHQDYYKGRSIVLTRFGPVKQSTAYKKYRLGCGRDARVEQLWGSSAPFIKH